jgi:LysR family transcriptional regulator, carnitine catabolism transcriptional activator
MNVTLRQLRAFVAVAEAGHFTKAAEKLDLPQSTISTLVRELEINLGLRLFDRHTRMLSLTQAGADTLAIARKTLVDLDSIIGNAHELKALGRGRVSIAASSIQASLLVPKLIREFSAQYPGVTVMLHDVSEKEVLQLVRAGEVDFGLGTASEVQHDLGKQLLSSDTFVAVLPPGHALARKAELNWSDLKDTPIIGARQGNPVWEHLDFSLAPYGIVLPRHYEVSLPLTMIGMVEGGLGITVLSTAASKLALALGLTIRKLKNPVVQREMSLIFHAERSLSPAAQKFRELLFQRRSSLGEDVA